VKFSRDGHSFLTCDQHGLRRWRFEESQFTNLNSQTAIGEPETLLAGLPVAGTLDTNQPPAQQLLALAQSASTECLGGRISADARFAALFGNGQAVLFGLEPRALFPFVELQNAIDKMPALSPDGRWLATTYNIQHGGPDVYDLREGHHAKRLAEAEFAGFIWHPQTGELVTQSSVEAIFWQPGTWKILRRYAWPNPAVGVGFTGFTPDGRSGWLNSLNGPQLFDLAKGEPYATLQFPKSLNGLAVANDPKSQRAYVAQANGILVYDLAELRRELARLGLDWPDEHPGEGFAPRR
jgi:hypothetical protein